MRGVGTGDLLGAAGPASYQTIFTGGRIWIFLGGTNLPSLAVPEVQEQIQSGHRATAPQSKQSFLLGSGTGT